MSFSLPDIDLSTAVVGTTGRILLQQMGISAGGVSAHPQFVKNPANLFIHNESPCGLGMTMKDSGQSFNLGSGQWVQVPLWPGESEIDYLVKYILPNSSVNLLMITYYMPGEPVQSGSTLGNSPIGGSLASNIANTVQNRSLNGFGAPFIDSIVAGDPVNAFGVQLTVDGQLFLGRATQSQVGSGGKISIIENPTLNGFIATGSTSGNALLYMPLRGDAKYVMLFVSSNYNSTVKTIALPTAFINRAQVRALDNAGPMRFLASGIAVGLDLVTGFTAGGVRTITSVTSAPAGGFMGCIKGAFDTVELSATGAVGPATIIIEGN